VVLPGLFTASSPLVSLLLLALLLFLLFGGSRISAAGKGLGDAVRHVKRAAADADDDLAPPAADPPMKQVSARPEPKLLPAKGESSASSEGRDE
jgi:Sec-independent protein translocase protein TatA